MSETEHRPGPNSRSNATYPREWGSPPEDKGEIRLWVEMNVARGRRAQERGEHVPWMAAETRA